MGFLSQFYDQYHKAADEGGWYSSVEARMQADFASKIAVVRSSASNAAAMRLLDVGCGKGYFVRACVDNGLQSAEGIDLSESGVAHAKEVLGVSATCGRLEDLAPLLGTYDVVTFWATIEHLPDPIATLSTIRSVLKPGGLLCLDTGIGDDWLDKLLPGRVQWYDPPQHLTVFSQKGMRSALNSAGFAVVSFDSCFDRSAGRKAMRQLRSALTASALRASAVLGRLSGSEFEFTRFPLGNLMMVVAKNNSIESA